MDGQKGQLATARARDGAESLEQTGGLRSQAPQKPKLLDQVRETIRRKHYSIRTEEAYVDWIKRYIFFHQKRHPSEMGAREMEQFLNHLAVQKNALCTGTEVPKRKQRVELAVCLSSHETLARSALWKDTAPSRRRKVSAASR